MRIAYIIPLVLVLLIAGCASSRKESQQEEARRQWNAARAGVLHSLAEEQYKTGRFDRASQTLADALRMDPQNPALHILSAKLDIEQGRLERAERKLELARGLDPEIAEVDYLSGVIFQRWEQPQRAYDYYQQAVEKAPAELAYLLAKSEMLIALDRSDEALQRLQEQVIYFEHSAAIRDAVGQLLLAEGRYEEAAAMFRRASVLDSEDLTIREHLGLSLFYAGRHQEAAVALGRLVQREPYSDRSDLIILLASSELHNGRLNDARTHFQSATRMAPESISAWLGQAKVALRMNDLRRAETSLDRARSLDRNSAEAHLLSGYLRLKQQRYRDALTSFHHANGLQGDDPLTLCMIGHTLEKMNRPAEALEYYGQALKLSPGDELAMKLMAGIE